MGSKNVDVHWVVVTSQEAMRKNDKNDLENSEIENCVFFWALLGQKSPQHSWKIGRCSIGFNGFRYTHLDSVYLLTAGLLYK